MLTIDIAGSTDHELQRIIGEACAAHGSVVKVMLHVSRIKSPSRPCAIVDMATPEQASRVADVFAANSIGKSVVILLEVNRRSAQPATASRRPPELRPKTMFQLLAHYESQARPGCEPCG